MRILFTFLLVLTCATYASSRTGNDYAINEDIPCSFFPVENIWNTPIDDLPVDANSDTYVQTIGASLSLHPDFGAGEWNGGPIGIPYVLVPGNQPGVSITFDYDPESDHALYPIPPNPPIEGGDNSTGDRHILMVDKDNCILYELYHCFPNGDGSWNAGSGAIYDLNSETLRPDGWTSADAAGLPILPGLVRYDEVAKGEIKHAIRFTVPKTQRKYIWPARHFASTITDKAYPPMGQRFRLKKNVDISKYSNEAKVILQAMKVYGMLLADNGSAWFISGVPDPRWNDDEIMAMRSIKGSDFEAVDESSLMLNPNSGKAKQNSVGINEVEEKGLSVSCYPNPFESDITIEVNLSQEAIIAARLYDVTGNLIKTLPESELPAGNSRIRWNLTDDNDCTIAQGLYFLYIKVNGSIIVKPVLHLFTSY